VSPCSRTHSEKCHPQPEPHPCLRRPAYPQRSARTRNKSLSETHFPLRRHRIRCFPRRRGAVRFYYPAKSTHAGVAGAAQQPRRSSLLRGAGCLARRAPRCRPAADCLRHRAGQRLVRARAAPGTDNLVLRKNDAPSRARSPGFGGTALPGIYNTRRASVPHRALMRAVFTQLPDQGNCTKSAA
jgi:hypothetical protein